MDVAQVSYQSDALLLPSRQCRRTEITLQNKSGHTYLGDGFFFQWQWRFDFLLVNGSLKWSYQHVAGCNIFRSLSDEEETGAQLPVLPALSL